MIGSTRKQEENARDEHGSRNRIARKQPKSKKTKGQSKTANQRNSRASTKQQDKLKISTQIDKYDTQETSARQKQATKKTNA